MPAQPAWFHRLDEILADLRSMTSTHLDRAAVEKLFRVRHVVSPRLDGALLHEHRLRVERRRLLNRQD